MSLADDVKGLMPRTQEDLARLVAIPSVADERQYPREECLKAAQLTAELFDDAGLDAIRELESPDGYPAVFGSASGMAFWSSVHSGIEPPCPAVRAGLP